MATGGPIPQQEDDFDFIDIQRALRDRFENLKFLVCGKTGVGKSSLVNVLVGKEVCVVGGPGEDLDFGEAFSAQTKLVNSVRVRIQDVLVTIFDSPGLQDGTENDLGYLEDMHQKCSDANLVLYCIDMTTTRWLPSELKATQLLTDKFGLDFWKKTVLVLTKGNTIHPRDDRDEVKHCEKVYNAFVQQFLAQLKDQGVPGIVANAIPAVAVGSKSEREIPYVSSKAKSGEPQDFLPELWITCMETISCSSRVGFLTATCPERFKFNNKGRKTAQQKQLIAMLQQSVEDSKKREEEELIERKKLETMNEQQQEMMKQILKEFTIERELERYPLDQDFARVGGPPAEFTDQQVDRLQTSLIGALVGIAPGALVGAGIGAVVGLVGGPIGALIGLGVGAGLGAVYGTAMGGTAGLLASLLDS